MERKRVTGRIIAFLAVALLSAAPVWAQGKTGSMKPMDGKEPVRVLKSMAELRNVIDSGAVSIN